MDMNISDFIQLQDLPFILIISVGIFLPELYFKFNWTYRTLATVRLITLMIICALAVIVNHIYYPGIDSGVMFTRAFIFIAFSRLVLFTSHQIAEKNAAKAEASYSRGSPLSRGDAGSALPDAQAKAPEPITQPIQAPTPMQEPSRIQESEFAG